MLHKWVLGEWWKMRRRRMEMKNNNGIIKETPCIYLSIDHCLHNDDLRCLVNLLDLAW